MTDEEINALTDQQINAMVTAADYELNDEWCLSDDESVFYHCGIAGEQYHSVKVEDYCNDPTAMMLIVFENGIGLFPNRMGLGESDLWTAAYSIYKRNNYTHTNPLRAAAIAYLKMKGVL